MREIPRPQETYRHFKGNMYQIVAIAKHSETLEELVIYQAMYDDFQVYARPLNMFLEKVDREKYPDVSQEYRFEKVSVQEECLDPLVAEFLDASTHEERLHILSTLHPRITEQMLLTMSIVVGVELKARDVQEQYEELKRCLLTLDKYEIQR